MERGTEESKKRLAEIWKGQAPKNKRENHHWYLRIKRKIAGSTEELKNKTKPHVGGLPIQNFIIYGMFILSKSMPYLDRSCKILDVHP